VPVPKPADDEVLVKLLAMGVCHSDCTILEMQEPIPGMQNEFVLGHEGAGEIVQLGSGVDKSQFSIGDKVALYVCPGCDKADCPDCSRGFHHLCHRPGSGNYGLGVSDGYFAEYVTILARSIVKLPARLDVAEAAVSVDAVLTSYHAVRHTANVQPDQTIIIYGIGGLGMNGLQTAIHLGVKRIFVVDTRQEALEAAMKLGIPRENAFCTSDPNVSLERYLAENDIHVDTSIDFVGHEKTIQSAQMCVRPGGTVVVVGLLSQTAPLIPMVSVVKALTFKMSYSGTLDDLRECLKLVAQGVIKPSVETGSIEDLPKVLQDLDAGKINSRMVLLPDWKKNAA
jgi:alcohol dehydrogenase, propanol-preferring